MKLWFCTLKVGMPLSWSCHALLLYKAFFYPMRTYAFRGERRWHSHFQGAKLKLILRAFCFCILCFFTSNGSIRILKRLEENFWKRLFPRFHKNDEIKKKKNTLKVSKSRKENTKFSHTPKNQRNFVHFLK